MGTIESKTFRDRPINIDESGKRKWIYAKQPRGKWYRRRTAFSLLILLFLILAPIIKVRGNPLMLLDIANRRFSIFGNIVYAQDTYILAVIMAVSVVFIVLFTVIFGRLWCGWACPQTVFMEMIYRRIEYLFDGNYRKKRKSSSPAGIKIVRTILKHITYFVVTVLLANIFLNWFTGPERLKEIITSPVKDNLTGFLVMTGISGFYYWIFAFFREQVCTMVCPYGRIQGVLLASRSITVSYDYKRGEPRGARNKGDCIDCRQCIAVCPTGIDIRNGTQLECVNCTACIDECNLVMQKVHKKPDLIRFDSAAGIETGNKALFNPRTYAYTAVLAILIIVLAFTVNRRKDIDISILRVPGALYQEIDSLTLSNIYNTKILNKSDRERELESRLLFTEEGSLQYAVPEIQIAPNGTYQSVLIVKIPKNILIGKSTGIKIGTFENGELIESTGINFIGPSKTSE